MRRLEKDRLLDNSHPSYSIAVLEGVGVDQIDVSPEGVLPVVVLQRPTDDLVGVVLIQKEGVVFSRDVKNTGGLGLSQIVVGQVRVCLEPRAGVGEHHPSCVCDKDFVGLLL